MRKVTTSVDSSMSVIRNLPKYLKASHAREGSAAKDYALNRCLNHIERINKVGRGFDGLEKSLMMREAWDIYFELAKFECDERADFNPHREHQLTARHDSLDSDIVADGYAVEVASPEVYSGGLGYRHVNWDSSYMMAVPKGKQLNPFWRPDDPRNKVGTKEHHAMLSLEESGYWACKPKEPDNV